MSTIALRLFADHNQSWVTEVFDARLHSDLIVKKGRKEKTEDVGKMEVLTIGPHSILNPDEDGQNKPTRDGLKWSNRMLLNLWFTAVQRGEVEVSALP